MKEIIVIAVVGLLISVVDSFVRPTSRHVCEGGNLKLDCLRNQRLQLLSANYGRTSKLLCRQRNQSFDGIDCISKKAKKIIYSKCDNKMFCSLKADSSSLGGDPCPGVRKYIDIIFKCVYTASYRKVVTTQSFPSKNITVLPSTTKPQLPFTTESQLSTIHSTVIKINKPNETNEERRIDSGQGFFRSMLVLLVILKDKPRHSLLSVMIGVASGTVIVLITVLICVCVDKRRQKNESACFNEAEKGESVELERSELLDRKKGSNCESNKTDDQVDSAFGEDDLDRQVYNDYETTSDMAYLDAYLDEYNKNRSLPRAPLAGNDRRNSGQQRMSRRAHNDGSKGRSYDYNSNNENSLTTFS